MQKIVLPPHTWTGFYGWAFQPQQPKAVRFRIGAHLTDDAHGIGRPTLPFPEEEAYFVTSSYDPKIIRLADYLPSAKLEVGDLPCFLMPDGNDEMSVIVSGFNVPANYMMDTISPGELASTRLLQDAAAIDTQRAADATALQAIRNQLATTSPSDTKQVNLLTLQLINQPIYDALNLKFVTNALEGTRLQYALDAQRLLHDVDNQGRINDIVTAIAANAATAASIQVEIDAQVATQVALYAAAVA